MSPRTRGNRQGSVRKRGRTWYLRYLGRGGKLIEKTTDATSKTEAITLLNREVEREWGRRGAVKTQMIGDLLPLVEADYERKGQETRYIAKRWVHVGPAFSAVLVGNLTTEALGAYVSDRLHVAKPSTVKQELALLHRMLIIGASQTPSLVDHVPAFPSIAVDNARTGFFEAEDFAAVCHELPNNLAALCTMAYWTGWRRGELLGLTWAQLDLSTGRVRLHRGTTKNKEGRVVVLPDQVLLLLRRWREETSAVERRTGAIVRRVFHRNGRPIVDFRRAWKDACEAAGVPERLFHDFRRSGTRNLVRSGVPEHVAMRITGHKTRSIFDRYDIVSEGDLEEAARKLSAQAQPKRRKKQGRKEGV